MDPNEKGLLDPSPVKLVLIFMPLVEALKFAAHLSVDRFGGAANLGFVLLLEQLELLLL